VEDGGVSEIKEVQPAERTGFPTEHLPAQDFLSDLPLYLTRQKVQGIPGALRPYRRGARRHTGGEIDQLYFLILTSPLVTRIRSD
jgi:hypothetical protein